MNFVADKMSLAAANVTLKHYMENDIAKSINIKGQFLKKKLNESIKKYKLDNLIELQGMDSRIIIGFKNNLDSDFLKKKDINIERIVRFMIEYFANRGILCNLSVFLNQSHTKMELIKFAKIFENICKKIKYNHIKL